MLPAAGEDDGASGTVAGELREEGAEVAPHALGEGVEARGPVDEHEVDGGEGLRDDVVWVVAVGGEGHGWGRGAEGGLLGGGLDSRAWPGWGELWGYGDGWRDREGGLWERGEEWRGHLDDTESIVCLLLLPAFGMFCKVSSIDMGVGLKCSGIELIERVWFPYRTVLQSGITTSLTTVNPSAKSLV